MCWKAPTKTICSSATQWWLLWLTVVCCCAVTVVCCCAPCDKGDWSSAVPLVTRVTGPLLCPLWQGWLVLCCAPCDKDDWSSAMPLVTRMTGPLLCPLWQAWLVCGCARCDKSDSGLLWQPLWQCHICLGSLCPMWQCHICLGSLCPLWQCHICLGSLCPLWQCHICLGPLVSFMCGVYTSTLLVSRLPSVSDNFSCISFRLQSKYWYDGLRLALWWKKDVPCSPLKFSGEGLAPRFSDGSWWLMFSDKITWYPTFQIIGQ